jgi:hypothetical protein
MSEQVRTIRSLGEEGSTEIKIILRGIGARWRCCRVEALCTHEQVRADYARHQNAKFIAQSLQISRPIEDFARQYGTRSRYRYRYLVRHESSARRSLCSYSNVPFPKLIEPTG